MFLRQALDNQDFQKDLSGDAKFVFFAETRFGPNRDLFQRKGVLVAKDASSLNQVSQKTHLRVLHSAQLRNPNPNPQTLSCLSVQRKFAPSSRHRLPSLAYSACVLFRNRDSFSSIILCGIPDKICFTVTPGLIQLT
jgi:hypothetical protein